MRRLPSKRWQAFYTGPDTQLHYAPTTFDTAEDAEAWLAAERRLTTSGGWSSQRARAEADVAADQARQANTFATYARGWLVGRHDLRPSTRASYRTSLERHLIPGFGDTPLHRVTAGMVRAWFGSYGDRTPTARAHAFQVLGAILHQAEEDELILRSPSRIKAGGRTAVLREPEVLTLRELLSLVEAMPSKHRALTLVCGLCGLRFGEAAALRRRDVDLDAGVLHVVRTAIRANGTKQAGPPKTEAGKRTVAMPAIVIEAVRAQLAQLPMRGRDALVFPGEDGEFLAPTALYGRDARTELREGRSYRKAAYGFYAARKDIGKPLMHWHDLRRTAATLGAQSGATVREMQYRLGHTTPTMALRYQSATADRDRAIANKLQEAVDQQQ